MHDSAALFWLCLLGVVLSGTACREAYSPAQVSSAQQQKSSTVAFTEVWIPWGTTETSVAIRSASPERLAEGVSAVALDPRGRVYLLDRLNSRVVRVAGDQLTRVNDVASDAEDLVVGEREQVAAYSPLHARIRVHRDGKILGDVAVPRVVAHPTLIRFAENGELALQNAFQETYRLGRPGLSQTPATVLRSKREGAFFTSDGTPLTIRVEAEGAAYLFRGRHRSLFANDVLSARLIGLSSTRICGHVERRLQIGSNRISRELRCVDLNDSQWSFSQELPEQYLYLPRRSVAMDGSTVAFINPETRGLRVMVWSLGRPAEGGEVQR